MLTIKVLGTGCPNCNRLEAEARAALESIQPGLDYELVKVSDFEEFVRYGILSVPALVMNEQVLVAGRVPKRQQIIEWALQFAQME
ncbi:MAG: thioredoxin family protein [Anaerolineae bacterium]|nr:thioredoxin family protein [Anaerolineae bacterium]